MNNQQIVKTYQQARKYATTKFEEQQWLHDQLRGMQQTPITSREKHKALYRLKEQISWIELDLGKLQSQFLEWEHDMRDWAHTLDNIPEYIHVPDFKFEKF